MDGADLLALCGENLVYRCDLVSGIQRGELCPFEYFGVRDVVDFTPIPWRNGKFEAQALTRAVETRERAEQALREWREKGGRRTLAFCCTVTHADFMAEFFRNAGVRAVAVHAGPSSAPRHVSVAALQNGSVEVLFSVDVFNEGLDVPEADSVLMLRPTESPVIFLQQLGRGLRKGDPGKVLRVVDFIGNHRSFLLKPRTLLSLGARLGSVGPMRVLEAMKKGEFDLPAGCRVAYDLSLVDMFRQLLRISTEDQLGAWCREVFEETGYRPSAAQAFRAGYNPASPRLKFGGWFDYLRQQELTTPEESSSVDAAGDFLRALETEAITKSYKLVLMRALLHEGALLSGMSIAQLSRVSHELVRADPRLLRDAQSEELPEPASASDREWEAYWRKWPISAWLGELKGEKGRWFELDGDRFVPRFAVPSGLEDTITAMTAELVEWRLARYLVGKEPIATGVVRCRVSHSNGNPIVFLPTKERAALPRGSAVPFRADGVEYLGDFVKVALNVARLPGEAGNALVTLLRRWFGPSAGHPGTEHRVLFEKTPDGWVLRPEVREVTATSDRGVVLPLFPDYAVACGAFGAPKPGERAPLHREIRPAAAGDPDDLDLFLVAARGNSMNGGADPIQHGDLLLMRWIRSESPADLVGQVVLVDKGQGATRAPALKRLTRAGPAFELLSDHEGEEVVAADGTVRVVGRLVRKLDQREFNPLATHLHQQFRREDIAPLYGQEFNPGNWNSGHVTLDGRIVLLTTLDKTAMSAGMQYEDRLVAPDLLEWTSQEKTKRTDKKGRALLESLNDGVEIHLWLRRSKREGGFIYCGLVTPVHDEGDAPIRVTWRLLTPLPADAFPGSSSMRGRS
jgi:8-oxo-dGTP pyrophosphatase MutT (NUDIX family)